MGNTPTKEAKPSLRSDSFSRDMLVAPGTLSGLSKKKKQKEKEKQKQKEQQILNLIVRYDENVDGGFLAPYNTYKWNLSFKTQIARELIFDRKLAPFYTPLQDFDKNWSDEELLNYIRGVNIHADVTNSLIEDEDEDEDPDDHKIHQSLNSMRRKEHKAFKKRLREAAVRLQQDACNRFQKDKSIQLSGIKTFENIPSDDLLLRLYRDAIECPICFLYFPQNLNLSRCCVQPICTECFVQMKRLDPHPPHDEGETPGLNTDEIKDPEDLISEPVKCPFCAMPDFGVTYSPPNFRTGLGGRCPNDFRDSSTTIEEEPEENTGGIPINQDSNRSSTVLHHRSSLSYAMSKSHSALSTPPRPSGSFTDHSQLPIVASASQDYPAFSITPSSTGPNANSNPISMPNTTTTNTPTTNTSSPTVVRKRRGSLPPTAPGVITIDFIRPDWELKLFNARAKLARRSAAATALHASSLLANGGSDITNNINASPSSSRAATFASIGGGGMHNPDPSRFIRRLSRFSRQNQMDIEERMIEQALRLSLLDEEERRLKERVRQ